MNHGIRSVSNVVDSTQPVMNGHPNECNIKVENWLMIFIVHAWHTAPLKRHFASAFNCFVCKYLQIGDGPKFCGRIEEESTFELTISLSLCVGFYYTISFLVLWLSWCVCLIYHRNAHTNIYSIQLFGTWIDSGMYLTQHRCTYVRWQVLYTQNTRTALLFISAETMYGKRTLELKVCERQTQCCTMIAFVLFQCICTFRARWCAIVIISGGTAYWLIKPWIALISNLSFWTDLLLNTLQHHLFICNVNTLNTA